MQLRFHRTKAFVLFFFEEEEEEGEEIKTLCDSVSRFHVYIRAISCQCFIESNRKVTANSFLWSMLLVKILFAPQKSGGDFFQSKTRSLIENFFGKWFYDLLSTFDDSGWLWCDSIKFFLKYDKIYEKNLNFYKLW